MKNNTEPVNNFVIYNCIGNATSNNISKIEYNHNDTEYELSTLAASTKNDIRNGNTKFFNSTNTTIIENAKITKTTRSKLIIKGDSCISESNNIKLVLPYNGNIKELSCKGYNSTNKKDEEFFYLECNNNGIKTNINNVYGYYVNQYSDFIINFANPNSTDINYEVFSVYQIEEEDYYLKTAFENESFITFVNNLKYRSIKDFGVDITEDNSILTLSTCANDNNYRVVLHAINK